LQRYERLTRYPALLAFAAPEQAAVEAARRREIVDRKSEMERRKRHPASMSLRA
jgi:hypothetical protein